MTDESRVITTMTKIMTNPMTIPITIPMTIPITIPITIPMTIPITIPMTIPITIPMTVRPEIMTNTDELSLTYQKIIAMSQRLLSLKNNNNCL